MANGEVFQAWFHCKYFSDTEEETQVFFSFSKNDICNFTLSWLWNVELPSCTMCSGIGVPVFR